MPIRTNRGRAAVYRKLWGWPLRSPLHLVATALGIVVVAALVALLSQHIRHTGGSSQPSGGAGHGGQAPTAALVATGPPSTRDPGPTEVPTSAAAAPAALQVAQQWGQAWVNHPSGITNQQWLAGLEPYTTDEFLPIMSTVDPANIPATKVTGSPTVVHSYTSSVEVTLPTDNATLDITVIQTPAGWRVAGYNKAGT